MAANSFSAVGLLDLLEQLPRDVLRDNLCLQLVESKVDPPLEPDAQVGRAFRLVSQRSLQLSDQLTRRLQFLFDTDGDGFDEGRTVKCYGAFLARQEGLRELSLSATSAADGGSLVVQTLLDRGAVCQQLQSLCIDTGAACSAAVARCISVCCPNLHELALRTQDLDSTTFLHLRHFQALTKVMVATPCNGNRAVCCGEVLSSLALLASLRTLEVEGILAPMHISLLAHLTRLEQLNARRLIISTAKEDGPRLGQALAGLTRLTQLAVPDCGPAGHAGDVLDAALAQLHSLRRLSDLSASSSTDQFPILEAGYATVCQMSSLTRLACPAAHGQAVLVGGGHLPLLQHLRIRSDTNGDELAAMLGPLQPLPQLRHIFFELLLAIDDEDDPDDADRRAVAGAWHAQAMLTAAPQLQPASFLIIGTDRETAVPLGPATALLTPLRTVLVHLRLLDLPAVALDALLPLLCQAGGLATLSLLRCHLSGNLLPLMAQHLPALRRLLVDECDGVTADSALEVAALRVQPLHLVWLPELTADQRRRFQVAARAGVTVGTDWGTWDDGDR